MKISLITLRNILGIKELEFSPDGFTVASGVNGSGKTSLIEGILSAFKQGHDATLLRKGEKAGEVVIVLDDGMTITKKVNTEGSSTEVRGADGKKLGRPAETIRALTDMLSVNPVEFLTTAKKDRVKVLLEAMPLEVDTDKLSELSGIRVTAQPGMHALHVIELVSKQVYDARTGTNRAVKEKEGAINQIRAAMPDAIDGVEGSEDEIAERVTVATTERDTMLGKISNKLAGVKTAAQEKIDVIRNKLQDDIDALKSAAQADIDAIQADTADNVNRANIAAETARAKHITATTPLNAALAAIRANREQAAKREQALLMVNDMVKELGDLRTESEEQTAALDSIEAYKSELLKKLPIAGLEVRDGEIFLNGIPFDRVNTAGQVSVAVGIAKLRAGDLGIVCVDRIECLDTANLEELRVQAAESGLQMFVSRVSDEDFSITTQD